MTAPASGATGGGGGGGGSATSGGSGGLAATFTYCPAEVCAGAESGSDGSSGVGGDGGLGALGASVIGGTCFPCIPFLGCQPEFQLVAAGGPGGGGGGGLFGGGGGAGFGSDRLGGGGGGGGSNLVPAGGSQSIDTTGVPQVVISYRLHPAATSVSCSPSPVVAGRATTCTATVTDTASSNRTTPTGTVAFTTGGPGSFTAGGQCTLASASGASTSCSVQYTPTSTTSNPNRSDGLTAAYGGDDIHTGSQGTAQETVISPTALATGSFVIGDHNAAVGTLVTFGAPSGRP